MRALAALTFVLGLTLVVFVATRDADVGRDSLEPEVEGVAANELSTAGGGLDPAGASRVEQGSEPAQLVLEETVGEAVRAPAAANGGLEIQLLDPFGAPVPDAPVLVLVEANRGAVRQFENPASIDALMEKYGKLRFTDSNGMLLVEQPISGPTLLVADSPPYWGSLQVDSRATGRIEFRLELDSKLRVQLLDSNGTPLAGERILLKRFDQWIRTELTEETARGDGIATFRHLQRALSEPGPRWIAVEALLEEPIKLEIDPEDLPQDVVVIELPPTGSVEVNVLALDGSQLAEPCRVLLGVVAPGESKELSVFQQQERVMQHQRVHDGHARFPLVQVGCKLEVLVEPESGGVATRTYGPGPDRAGEVRSFEVRLGEGNPVIAFRAIDEDHDPLSSVELSAACEVATLGSDNSRTLKTTTDEDGLATLDLSETWIEGTRRTLTLRKGTYKNPELQARVELSYLLPPEVHDLGEIVFREELPALPVFAAGAVVTTDGASVPRAKLTLYGRHAGQSKWKRLPPWDRKADQRGRFELREALLGDEFMIEATRGELRGPLVELHAGDLGVTIELSAGGAIEGSLLLDAGVSVRDVWVRIPREPSPSGLPESFPRQAAVLADGSFRIVGLPPGSYEIQVGARNQYAPQVTVSDVVVRSGESTRDPRLAEIDLRGELYQHRVHLSLPVGEQLQMSSCRVRRAGSEAWTAGTTIGNTTFSFLTTSERIDIEVFVPGFRSVYLGDVAGSIEVKIERAALPIRLVLRGGAKLPAAPLFLKAHLVPRGAGLHAGGGPFGPEFNELGEAKIEVPGPGEMEVRWWIERRNGSVSGGSDTSMSRKIYFDVLDVEDEQVFEFVLSEEEIEQLVSNAR